MGASINLLDDGFSYISTTDGPADSISDFPFTIATYVQVNSIAFGEDNPLSISDATTLGGASNFSVSVTVTEISGDLAFRFIIKSTEGTSFISAFNTGIAFPNPNWYHLVAVCTSSTSKDVYVDGDLKASDATTKSFISPSAIGSAIDLQRLKDGNQGWLQLYDKALSVEEIQEIMKNPMALPENLKWSISGLQDAYGSTASNYTDISGNGWNCNTIFSSPSESTIGPPIFMLGGQ